MALKASAPFHSAVGKECKRREHGTHTRTGRLVCGDLTGMRRLWFGVVLDGTLYQACLTEGRALRQLLYTILFMWLVQATMESSSSGSTLSASAAFIEEHMSLHGAGLSVKVRTAVIRVLGAIGPEDEDDLGLIGEADFELLLKAGLGAFCILPAIASH